MSGVSVVFTLPIVHHEPSLREVALDSAFLLPFDPHLELRSLEIRHARAVSERHVSRDEYALDDLFSLGEDLLGRLQDETLRRRDERRVCGLLRVARLATLLHDVHRRRGIDGP